MIVCFITTMTFCTNKFSESRDIVSLEDIKVSGYFSVNSKREATFDSSNIRYFSYSHAKPPLDLEEGIEKKQTASTSSRTDEHINYLLRWILKNDDKIRAPPSSGRLLRPNFICTRGTISTFMRTPFLPKEEWIMCAGKWKGSIYISDFDTEARKLEVENYTAFRKRSWYWGDKFEQYMLADDPNKPPNTSKPVNGDVEFYCIFESRVGHHRLLYSAEMDGICSEKKLEDPLPLDELKFIELKTNKVLREGLRGSNNFKRFKSLQWWCQSFPIKTENILCGLRDDNGVVHELEYIRVSELADNAKWHGMWSSTKAISFLNDFLQHIEKIVVDDCTKTIYKFVKTPYKPIEMTRVAPSSEYGAFMPKWYINS